MEQFIADGSHSEECETLQSILVQIARGASPEAWDLVLKYINEGPKTDLATRGMSFFLHSNYGTPRPQALALISMLLSDIEFERQTSKMQLRMIVHPGPVFSYEVLTPTEAPSQPTPSQPTPSQPTPSQPQKEPSKMINPSQKSEAPELKDIQIDRQGTTLVVPAGLDLGLAIEALKLRQEEEDATIAFSCEFEYGVAEGMVSFVRVLEREFGFVSPTATPTFWGDQPPNYMSIEVAPGVKQTIPWGRLKIPGIFGWLSPSYAIIHDKVLFRISGEIKGKSRFEADRVATLVKKECQQHSIYKGQAIETSFPSLRDHEVASLEDTFPTFSKLSKLTEADLIFPVDVWDQVDVSLFTPIKKAQKCRDRQIPLKRGILLEGPFGVGKTLTAAVTQALCKEHGWTFIYLKDVTRLAQAYAFAEQYQPAVIFGEDVDKVVRGDRTQAMDDILNQLDGLNTKGIEVITVLTTNNVEDIIKGMIRPGRLDTVVPVRPPDAEAAARLVRLYARGFLAEGIDLTEVSKLLAGKIPAAIREIVERAKIATLRRDEDDMVIRSEDLIVTARSMQAHMDLLHRKEPEYLSDLEEAALIEAEGRIAAARIIAGLPEASPGTSPVAPVKFVRNNYTS